MRFISNFFSNLGAALWMLVGSTRAFNLVKPTFAQFSCFLVVALSANILFAWLAAPSDAAAHRIDCVNQPTPAIVAQSAVRRLPRWALLLLCFAYVIPGFNK